MFSCSVDIFVEGEIIETALDKKILKSILALIFLNQLIQSTDSTDQRQNIITKNKYTHFLPQFFLLFKTIKSFSVKSEGLRRGQPISYTE